MAKPRMERPARVASMPRAEGPAEVAMREYVCDSCGSPAGMACVTRAGRFARFAHAARYAAAERDGKVGAVSGNVQVCWCGADGGEGCHCCTDECPEDCEADHRGEQ